MEVKAINFIYKKKGLNISNISSHLKKLEKELS
jgi:hypothetical protein